MAVVHPARRQWTCWLVSTPTRRTRAGRKNAAVDSRTPIRRGICQLRIIGIATLNYGHKDERPHLLGTLRRERDGD